MIYIPAGRTTAHHHRVSFTGKGNDSRPAIHEPIDVGVMNDVIHVQGGHGLGRQTGAS